MASRLQDVILRGPAASKPAANTVAPGTLYHSSDFGITDRSNGVAWESYTDIGSVVGLHAATHAIAGTDPVPIESLGGLRSTLIIKPTDESVNNTTLQNDNDFARGVLANERWIVNGCLFVTGSTLGDMTFAWNAPAGAVGWHSGIRLTTVATTVNDNANLGAIEDLTDAGFRSGGTVGVGTPVLFNIVGAIINGATPGVWQFRWAQAVADAANPTIIHSGSYMLFTRG